MRGRRKKIIRLLLVYSLGSLILFVLAAGLFYAFCPKPELKAYTSYSSGFFDSRDKLMKITLARDDRYRLYQTLEQINPNLVEATILYEDQDFYEHFGVDLFALARAFIQTYLLRERRIGASTITMQVARLRWNISSHSLDGKFEQIFRALQLSRHYSKQAILQAYFNMAPYGGNIEGIGAASLIYFGKKPAQLSLPEALTLAVIPQNPAKRNPAKKIGYQELLIARDHLLQRWLEKFPKDAHQKKFFALPLKVRSKSDLPNVAPHFYHYLTSQRSSWQSGIVDTTLDPIAQKKLEQIVKNYVASKSINGIHNAAALLVNYRTMEIKAMVGSADFHDDKIQGQVNGTLAKRSPGSTLKPFVYGLAIDEGLIHPMTLLKDSPHAYGGFTPENYDKRFLGPIAAKKALIQSRNVPAVNLQAQLTERSFYDFLKSAGVSQLKPAEFYGLALALGGGELSMLELVSLYAALANQGQLKPIKAIHSPLADGETEANPKQAQQLLSPEASFMLLDMLKDNPAPDALDINTSGPEKNQVAWKTGTSWAFRDAWSVGVSGDYVLAVWVGNFTGKGHPSFVGRTAAGPLLFAIFQGILPARGWQVEQTTNIHQLNIKSLEVCATTGDLLEKHCPVATRTWFIPGKSPIKLSNIYRKISIHPDTGLRSCQANLENTRTEVYEFWPSDLLHIFAQAGISLKTPPAYEAGCNLNQKSNSGQVPVITSPQSNVEYLIQSDDDDKKLIPFTSVVDADVNKVFWFVNDQYVGSSVPGAAFIWQGTRGDYRVRAVDDAGRSASKAIKVVQIQ